MSRFLCSCIFLAGVIMLALAVGLFLNGQADGERSILEARLAVQDAVASLEPCETCHSGAAQSGTLVAFRPLVQASRPAVDAPALAESMPQVDYLRVELDARLAEAGQRVLEAPASDDPAYRAAIDHYLAVYHAAQSDLDGAQVASALHALDGVTALLAESANRASPVRLDRTPEPAPRCLGSAAQSAPPPLVRVAASAQGVILDQTPAIEPADLSARVYVPSRVVVVSHRCDPPAGAIFDSVSHA
jgi:hypothetical protein